MKYKILYTLLAFVAFAFGCKKTEYDETSKGEALGAFSTTAPANNTMLVLNSATPNNTIEITWTAAKPGINTAPTYKWVAALKSGNIDQPILEFPSDNGGKASKLTLSQKQLDDALKAKGIADGVKTELIWRVIADNGSLKVNGETFNISVTRFGDGVSNFILYGPLSSTTVMTINPLLTGQSLNFKWQKSFGGKVGTNVTYKVKFIKPDGDFNTPLFQFSSNNNGLDSSLAVSYKDFDVALTAAGFSDQSAIDSLKWSVEATAGAFSKFSDYTNDLSVLRDVNLYMVGSASEFEWNNGNPTYMYRDETNRGTYLYTGYLRAGEFKFITVPGSWEIQYGNNGSNGVAIKAKGSDPDPGTYAVATAGYYTVKIDINALTFSITPYNATGATTYTSIGIIGGFTNWGDIIPMEKTTFNPHIWTITHKFDTDIELKFRIAEGWDVNWGATEANKAGKYGKGVPGNGANLAIKAGTYKILFNDLTGDYILYNQ